MDPLRLPERAAWAVALAQLVLMGEMVVLVAISANRDFLVNSLAANGMCGLLQVPVGRPAPQSLVEPMCIGTHTGKDLGRSIILEQK
jgi:hypothetical protein